MSRIDDKPTHGIDMKILMIFAVLITVAGVALSDSILGVLGGVSLACSVVDVLVSRYSVRLPVQA